MFVYSISISTWRLGQYKVRERHCDENGAPKAWTIIDNQDYSEVRVVNKSRGPFSSVMWDENKQALLTEALRRLDIYIADYSRRGNHRFQVEAKRLIARRKKLVKELEKSVS